LFINKKWDTQQEDGKVEMKKFVKRIFHPFSRILSFWRQYRECKAGVVGIIVISILIFLATFAPFLAPYDPFDLSNDLYKPPSIQHLLGTDALGRDIFSRIIFGTRVALIVAIGSAGLSVALGVILGSIPGWCGGIIDDIFTRGFDIIMVIPVFFLMVVLISLFGASVYLVTFGIGITIWPGNARLMRAQVLSLKKRAFVEAAIMSGAGGMRALFMHVIPNTLSPVIANIAVQMGSAILIEAGLSFLGLGDPNLVSWGQMVYGGSRVITFAWWVSVFPGLAIVIAVFGFNLIADGMNYVINPRLRE